MSRRRIPPEDRRRALELWTSGVSKRDICEEIGVTRPTLTKWINNHAAALPAGSPTPTKPAKITDAEKQQIAYLKETISNQQALCADLDNRLRQEIRENGRADTIRALENSRQIAHKVIVDAATALLNLDSSAVKEIQIPTVRSYRKPAPPNASSRSKSTK